MHLLSQIQFSTVISLGDLLKIIAILGGFIGIWHKMDIRLTVVERDIIQIRQDMRDFKIFWDKIVREGWIAQFHPHSEG